MSLDGGPPPAPPPDEGPPSAPPLDEGPPPAPLSGLQPIGDNLSSNLKFDMGTLGVEEEKKAEGVVVRLISEADALVKSINKLDVSARKLVERSNNILTFMGASKVNLTSKRRQELKSDEPEIKQQPKGTAGGQRMSAVGSSYMEKLRKERVERERVAKEKKDDGGAKEEKKYVPRTGGGITVGAIDKRLREESDRSVRTAFEVSKKEKRESQEMRGRSKNGEFPSSSPSVAAIRASTSGSSFASAAPAGTTATAGTVDADKRPESPSPTDAKPGPTFYPARRQPAGTRDDTKTKAQPSSPSDNTASPKPSSGIGSP